MRIFTVPAALALAVGLLSACGSSHHTSTSGATSAASTTTTNVSDENSGLPGGVIAEVGSVPVTRAELNHWMTTLSGGDYAEVSKGHIFPDGLISDPPNYDTCVSNLKTIAEQATPKQAPVPSPAVLLQKCQQLHLAITLQAAAYLVHYRWLKEVVASEGLRVPSSSIDSALNTIRTKNFRHPGEYQEFLRHNRRTPADERVVVEIDLLNQVLGKQLEAGGKAAEVKLTETEQQWTNKTNCRSGYIVLHCRQTNNTPPVIPRPSATVLSEQLATLTGTKCINRQACG